MSRSLWKGPFSLKQKLRSNSEIYKQNKSANIWSRNCIILPEFVGKAVQIYNGKSWARRKIIESMVGHKFGEFSYTRKRTIHKTNKSKQRSRSVR